AEVRSLTQPLGKPVPGLLASRRGARGTDMFAQARLAALTHYVAAAHDGGATRHVTRLDLILASDPFDAESAATMQLVQTWLREELPRLASVGDLRSDIFGVTANAHDLAEVTESDRL